MFEQEIWKDIEGYEGYYKISNLGNVKSIPRNGTIKKEKILTPVKNQDGYLKVLLSKNGKRKSVSIHRLVANAFIKNNLNKLTVNHKDGNKLNNKISNLEWATHKEQTNHAYKNNLIKHYKRKINQYDLEGNFIKSYNSIAEAQKINNISRGMICKCCKKIRNKTGGYKWEYVDDNN